MILVNLHGITKYYGGRRILDELEFRRSMNRLASDWWAQMAPASLPCCASLAGHEDIQAGELPRRKGLRIAYPAAAYARRRANSTGAPSARPDLAEIEEQLRSCEAELSEPA